jgi:hypothetical protein
MPFKSKAQMKACFATNGFHGKIDCEEWAKDTNYKSLPKKKKEDGGYNMYRPKNCKKCGGKARMQGGGLQPYMQANTPQGAITPTGQSSLASNSQLTLEQLQSLAKQFGFRADSNQNFQQDLFSYAQKNQPDAYNKVMGLYGQTNAGTFVDGILGARTSDLAGLLKPPVPQPAEQQAALTEWLYGADKHAIGQSSQPYRDSKSASDPGILNGPEGPQYVDFMYNKPDSQQLDDSKGRYRIPYNVWSNLVTKGTTTVMDPSVIEQYKPSNLMGMRMKGGRLQRMQGGGPMPRQQDFPDYESWQAAMDEWHNGNAQQILPAGPTMNMLQNFSQPVQDFDRPAPEPAQQPLNPVQDGIRKGLIEAPRGFDTTQQWYDYMNTPPPKQKKRNNNPYQTMQNVGLGLQAARTGLGWLSGAIERGRQNQYDMMQQTALGQMNPMQSSDFQPNPYNLYMQMGGNLKTIMQDYQKWSNDAGPMDMTDGKGNPNMKKGGYEIDRMIIVRKLLPELLNFGKIGSNYRRYRGMKKGGIYIKPENKGKFTDYCGGKVTDECIQKGLNSPSATIRKRANFARNARKWNR